MRMWKVDPTKMCMRHLCGEHVEMHMFVGAINKEHNLRGYIEGGLVEIHNIKNRHDLLAQELERRGGNHKSLLPEFNSYYAGNINIDKNIKELHRRCVECRKLL